MSTILLFGAEKKNQRILNKIIFFTAKKAMYENVKILVIIDQNYNIPVPLIGNNC